MEAKVCKKILNKKFDFEYHSTEEKTYYLCQT